MKEWILGLIMVGSLIFAYHGTLVPLNVVALVIVLGVLIIDVFRIKNKKALLLLLVSSIYYYLMFAWASGMALLPLVVVPVVSAMVMAHENLQNRLAMAFWFVVGLWMVQTMYPPALPYTNMLMVFISYFLQMTVIFDADKEVYAANEMAWLSYKERNPNFNYFNANHFDRKE